METANCNNSYEERNSIKINIAEQRFEQFCKDRGILVARLGFNEKEHPIPLFFKLHPLIRSLPDYVIVIKNSIHYIHVKGSNKLKLIDLSLYKQFSDQFCNPDSKLFIAIPLPEKTYIISLNNISKIVKTLPVKEFENDHKQYVEIPLDKLTHK